MIEFTEETVEVGADSFRLAYAQGFPEASDEWYWASLWPSSIALAEHVLGQIDLEGTEVLELGCGCGLAGIAAGKSGAKVTATDLMPDALALTAENWRRNRLKPERIRRMDWGNPDVDARYDVILGADVLYDEKSYTSLKRSLRSLLKPGGQVIIAEPGRPQAHGFFARMLQSGYRIDTRHYTVELYGETFEISVSELG
jgi:predicted nicotinamide N-methyase